MIMIQGSVWLLCVGLLVQLVHQAQGQHFIGCYVDAGTRDLPVLAGEGHMTVDKCNQLCLDRRYKYFGLQNSIQCWCGNGYGRYGIKSIGECNLECQGDSSQLCGAVWRNTVYATEATPGLRYQGCFADSDARDLPTFAGSGSMSVRKCQDMCKARGFPYFGLQFADECFCGLSFGSYGVRPPGECNLRCKGDSSAMCGATWRNSVYATGLSPLSLPAFSHSSQPTLRDQLISQIRSQYVQFPDGVVCHECLISTWTKRQADSQSRVFSVRDIAAVMSSYPTNVRDKVNTLQFGTNAKTTFEGFEMDMNGENQVFRKSYLGMARRSNDNIEFGMVSVHLVGDLVPKFNVHLRETCRKILWVFKKCTTNTITEARGYHPGELELVDKAMRSETFRLYGQKVGQVNV